MQRMTDAETTALMLSMGEPPESGGFHSQDGLTFSRLDDGRVRVSVIARNPSRVVFTTIHTPEVWASIVSSMSAEGEDYNTWAAALAVHMGKTGESVPA